MGDGVRQGRVRKHCLTGPTAKNLDGLSPSVCATPATGPLSDLSGEGAGAAGTDKDRGREEVIRSVGAR